MKNILAVVGLFFAVLLLIVFLTGFWFGFRWVTAPFSGAVDAREQLESGRSRIAKYDHFFDLCQEIQATEDKIDNAYNALQQVREEENTDEIQRWRTNLHSLQNMRADLARQYNADARKEYTQARFKSDKLPWDVPTSYEPGGDKCECTVN